MLNEAQSCVMNNGFHGLFYCKEGYRTRRSLVCISVYVSFGDIVQVKNDKQIKGFRGISIKFFRADNYTREF